MTGNKLSKCFHEDFMLIVVLEMLNRLKIYTSMKGFFIVINRCVFTGTVSASTPLST